MSDKKGNQSQEKLNEIKSSLDSTFDTVSFQIDFINEQITPQTEIVSFLNENSSRLQHLLDEEPRLIRWWFDSFDIALKAMTKISKVEDLAHRLICVEKHTLFIQVGDF